MISLNSNRLLALICFICLWAFALSCKKDKDEENSGKVELFSFGPTGSKHGDLISFIGKNLNKVTSIEFTGGAGAVVQQKDFKEQTSELIKVIVPSAAEKGHVTLKTADGNIVTKTQFNLNVLSTVTSLSSQSRPGENVTLTGNFLNWIDRITFNKDKTVTTFISQSQTELVVRVPDDAQTGPLILHYAGTDSADFETSDTLKVILPIAVSMSPNPVKPKSNVTITGTDLDLTKKVIFAGVAAPVTTFVSQSATQLVVTVPETAKKGKLILEAASGVQTTSDADLDIVLPVVAAMSPNPINLGSDLTITGTDLDLTKKVIFAGVAAPVTTFVSQSATQLVVTVPAGSRKGKIKLEAASGVQSSSGTELDIVLPTISAIAPNPIDPGTNLTITGSRLNLVTSVAFQNAAPITSFVSQTATQIVVTVPAGVLRGKVTLGISNPTDTIQSNDILDITGAAPPPTISFPIYNDAVTSNWNGWIGGGWGGTKDLNNTAPVREGTKSAKIVYNPNEYGSPLQLGGANINWSSYSTFKISIYGAPGSGGKSMQIKINGENGPSYQITIVEGKWTDYAIPISSFTGVSVLNEIWIQALTGGGGFTVYVDAIGLN